MNERYIFDFYVKKGFSRAGAAGMTANINIESAYNPKNLQNSYEKHLRYNDHGYTAKVDSGEYKNFVNDRAGYGLCQWTAPSRKAGLLEYAKSKGQSIGHGITQLEYSLIEMSASLKKQLQTIEDPYEAAVLVMLKYEKPANQSENNQITRGRRGVTVYERCVTLPIDKYDTVKKEGETMKYKIYKHYLTKNRCYTTGRKMKPTGIVVHSTACDNKNITRYVDIKELGQYYKNHWNNSTPYLSKCVHFFIGWSSVLEEVVIVQTLPLDMQCWGCGSGKNGSYNKSHIQFEICEDNLKDKTYFEECMKAAQWLCRYIMDECNIKIDNVVSHAEANKKGYASNHGDIDHWLKKYKKNMNWFRSEIPGETKEEPKEVSKTTFKGELPKLPSRGYFKNGDISAEVCKLKVFLNYYGDYGLNEKNRNYFNATESYVKQFQKKEKLVVDGLFGKKCLERAKQIVNK